MDEANRVLTERQGQVDSAELLIEQLSLELTSIQEEMNQALNRLTHSDDTVDQLETQQKDLQQQVRECVTEKRDSKWPDGKI